MPDPADPSVRVDGHPEVAPAPDLVRVLVLGPLAVEHNGRPLHVAGTHRRRLLAYLVSRVGQAVSLDAIVDALWGDEPPPTAARTIQSHVARLRGSFAAVDRELIETTGGGYRLALDPSVVDATEFEVLADEGRRRLEVRDFGGAVSVLDRALAVWRGDAYVDFTRSAEFASAEAVRLDMVRWAAAEDLAEARLHCGALDSVIASVERLVAEQPGRERAWGLLMWALYAAGRQHDALVAFQRARRALADGFGLDPGPDLRTMEQRILAQDPALTVRREPAVPAGLRRDSTVLVGRRTEWAWLVDAWRTARAGSGQLRLLLGPTDSGRTRLAAELAATATIDGGQVMLVRGEDGFDQPPTATSDAAVGGIIDRVMERSRAGPVLLVVDDAEWSDVSTAKTIVALADSIEHAALMVLVIADPSGSGPSVRALLRLDPSQGRTRYLETMDDESLAQLVAGDGVDDEGVATVLAVAGGLPGVARREAATWAERAAGDRLAAAAASSIDATAVAVAARASMFHDVLSLVAARTRRDELTSSVWLGRQPYRALAAYQPHDADLFVGRERLVAELAARVLDRGLVAVIGASGTGKSSLVRAGLVPLVRSGLLPGTGPWRTTVIVPSADPDSVLGSVDGLDEPGPQLLVVDQFEEIFASGSSEVWAQRILDLVLDTALDVHAVIVLRADQYGLLAAIPSLATLVEDAQVAVGPPTDDELRRIVEVPARRTGCHVEPALIDMVLDDVAGHDAALPLVSAALADVWAHRVGNTLTVDGYARLGGLAAAVERMGARAVERSGGEDEVRDVMLRLVDVTEDGQWVRRRVPVDELPEDLAIAVEGLVEARLVQLDNEQLDVVHEVVFHAWPRLASWLEEARAELVLDRELRSAARAWDVDGRRDDDLYRGARLVAGDEFVTRRTDVSAVVREFVAAGKRSAERTADERARQRARVNRRLRSLLAATAVMLVLALVAGALAVRQADRAEDEAVAAEAAATLADVRRASTQALVTSDLEQALLLAVEGARFDGSAETNGNLLRLLTDLTALPIASVPRDVQPADADGARRLVLGQVAVSPRGDRLASAERGGLVLRDARTLDEVGRASGSAAIVAFSEDGELLAGAGVGTLDVRDADTLDVVANAADVGGAGSPAAVAFQPGGDQLAVAFPDAVHDPVRLYDVPTLAPADARLGGLPDEGVLDALVYSRDGRQLAAAFSPDDASGAVLATTVVVWDTDAPAEPVARISAPGADFIEFSVDGALLYASVYPLGVYAYDTATGAEVAVSNRPTGSFFDVSPTGTLVAATGVGPVWLFDAVTLEVQQELPTPSGETWFFHPRFSNDGTSVVAVGSQSGRVYKWDVVAGGEPQVIGQVDGGWTDVDVLVSPDDATVQTPTRGALAAWDIHGGQSLVELSPARAEPENDPELAVFVGDDQVAYFAGFAALDSPGGSVQFFDIASGQQGGVIDLRHGGLGGPSFSSDGTRLATTGNDGFVRVWDVRTGRLLNERRISDTPIGVSYEGDTLVVANADGQTHVLDAETLAPTRQLMEIGVELNSFNSTGGPTAVAVTVDGRVLLVDFSDGSVVEAIDPGFSAFFSWLSPDDRTVAITSQRGDVRLYDLEERQWLAPTVASNQGLVLARFSPDGSMLLTFGFGGAVGLWDAATGELIGTVLAEIGVPTFAGFVGDNLVTVATLDGRMYTWNADPTYWIEVACDVAGRNLTSGEWQEAFGDRPYRATCPSN
jgi:DNA-binding SARP family transcriptional activator/WD40 repeat protein